MRPRSNIFLFFLIIFAVVSIITLRSIEPTYGTNQLLFFLGSIGAYFAITTLDFYWYKKFRWWWYGGVIALLIVTLLIGRATNGSVSWIRLGAYRLQPSEFLKPSLMILLAVEGALFPLVSWRAVARFLAIAALPLGLIMMQPDLGTTLVTLAGVGAIFLLSRPKLKFIATLALASGAILVISWLWLLKPYQKDRILTFFQPTSDPQGAGYNARQAMIAVGAGQWWGQGLGNGMQSTLRFLPERQTDFLFATYSESTGLIGSTFLVSLYAALFFFLCRTLLQVDSPEKIAIITGIFAILFAQSIINIGMNIGLLPITGVTLPLFSLGGSSVLTTAMSLGLVESVRRNSLPEHAHRQ